MKIQDVKKHIFYTLEPFASANGFKILKGRFDLIQKNYSSLIKDGNEQ